MGREKTFFAVALDRQTSTISTHTCEERWWEDFLWVIRHAGKQRLVGSGVKGRGWREKIFSALACRAMLVWAGHTTHPSPTPQDTLNTQVTYHLSSSSSPSSSTGGGGSSSAIHGSGGRHHFFSSVVERLFPLVEYCVWLRSGATDAPDHQSCAWCEYGWVDERGCVGVGRERGSTRAWILTCGAC